MRLSICRTVGPGTSSWSSVRRQRSQTSSFAALAVAMYSAWVEEVATVDCCLDVQDMAPPERRKAYPDTEQQFDQSFAQSALVYPISSLSPIIYMMPQFGEPARYHMICLRPSMWSWTKVTVNGASARMAEQMSGHVPSATYMSNPITSRYGYEETVECSSDEVGSKLALAESGVDTGMQSAIP